MKVDTSTAVDVPLDAALPIVERLAQAIEAFGWNIQVSVFTVSCAWVLTALIRKDDS